MHGTALQHRLVVCLEEGKKRGKGKAFPKKASFQKFLRRLLKHFLFMNGTDYFSLKKKKTHSYHLKLELFFIGSFKEGWDY